MSLTYATYKTTIANLMEVDEGNADFLQILPSIIDYAEERIYNDSNPLSEVVTDTSATLNANTRTFTLPVPVAGTFSIVDQINLLESGSRTPLQMVSRELLDFYWSNSTAASSATRPQLYAMQNATQVSVGPVSGASVNLEIKGIVKPIPLSVSNTSTYLTQEMPALFIAASMVYACGYQQNLSENRGTEYWTAQYNALLKGDDENTARSDGAGASWTTKRVEPYAQPQRG